MGTKLQRSTHRPYRFLIMFVKNRRLKVTEARPWVHPFCVTDVMDKAGMCSKNIKYVTSPPPSPPLSLFVLCQFFIVVGNCTPLPALQNASECWNLFVQWHGWLWCGSHCKKRAVGILNRPTAFNTLIKQFRTLEHHMTLLLCVGISACIEMVFRYVIFVFCFYSFDTASVSLSLSLPPLSLPYSFDKTSVSPLSLFLILDVFRE